MTVYLEPGAMSDIPAREYYPLPESKGGWRWLKGHEQVRSIAGMDPEKLRVACEYNARFEASSQVVIVRNGYLVAEWNEPSGQPAATFNVASCTKSFTGTAFGILFEDCRQGKLPSDRSIDLDTPAYRFIPEGHPLSDPRKERVTFRHLLSMTSGIPGEDIGIMGVPTETGVDPFAAALGYAPVKARRWASARWTSKLSAEPGTHWDYSDPAFAHLALAFHHVTGREIADFVKEMVFDPIGIELASWDVMGVGAGFIGPHTSPHTGLHLCARELARFGYLMLRTGNWQGRQLVSPWWCKLASQSSQSLNPHYGYTWWVNTQGTLWPGVPKDAFAAMGFMSNKCYVVPSLDLVISRVGTGPSSWEEGVFIGRIVKAVIQG